MRRAIKLSKKAALEEKSGGPFGAVVVHNSTIIGEGYNQVIARNDSTWHAEMEALRQACATLGSYNLE